MRGRHFIEPVHSTIVLMIAVIGVHAYMHILLINCVIHVTDLHAITIIVFHCITRNIGAGA